MMDIVLIRETEVWQKTPVKEKDRLLQCEEVGLLPFRFQSRGPSSVKHPPSVLREEGTFGVPMPGEHTQTPIGDLGGK